MPELSVYALALLACPVGMGVMMWMMRGKKSEPVGETTAQKQAELAEIDQLRAADRDRRDADAVRRPAP